jgi:hypothetical protein
MALDYAAIAPRTTELLNLSSSARIIVTDRLGAARA